MLIPQVTPRALSKMTTPQRIANAVGRVVPKKIGTFFEMNQMGTLSRIPLLLYDIYSSRKSDTKFGSVAMIFFNRSSSFADTAMRFFSNV